MWLSCPGGHPGGERWWLRHHPQGWSWDAQQTDLAEGANGQIMGPGICPHEGTVLLGLWFGATPKSSVVSGCKRERFGRVGFAQAGLEQWWQVGLFCKSIYFGLTKCFLECDPCFAEKLPAPVGLAAVALPALPWLLPSPAPGILCFSSKLPVAKMG